jgi:hypothetical protein
MDKQHVLMAIYIGTGIALFCAVLTNYIRQNTLCDARKKREKNVHGEIRKEA